MSYRGCEEKKMDEVAVNESGLIVDLSSEHVDREQSLFDHLSELRSRIIYSMLFFFVGFIVSYIYSDKLFEWLLLPLCSSGYLGDGYDGVVIYTQMTEAFTTYVRLSLFGGFIISFPVIAFNLWKFVAPGLYRDEKLWLLSLMIVSPLLFLLGGLFAYRFIIPLAWSFFAGFQTSSIHLLPRLSEYLSIIMQFIIAFGLSFQLPVVLVLLGKLGVVSVEQLIRNRKIAFIGIMIVSAFLTPPDVLSMLGLTFPIYSLYELSIFVLNLVMKRDRLKKID